MLPALVPTEGWHFYFVGLRADTADPHVSTECTEQTAVSDTSHKVQHEYFAA